MSHESFATVDRKVKAGTVTAHDLVSYADGVFGMTNGKKALAADMAAWMPILKSKQPDVYAAVSVDHDQIAITDAGTHNVYPYKGVSGDALDALTKLRDVLTGGQSILSPGSRVLDKPAEDVTKAGMSVTQFVAQLGASLFSTQFWIRALELVIGILLVAIGMAALARDAGATKLQRQFRRIVR